MSDEEEQERKMSRFATAFEQDVPRTARAVVRGLTLVAAALLVAACATSRKADEPVVQTAFGCPVGPTKNGSMENLLRTKVSMEGKKTPVVVTGLRCTRNNELLRIEADLRNPQNMVHRVAYRMRWLDSAGMAAASEESWKPVLMYENANDVIVVTAPNANVADFRLVVMGQDK